MNHPLPHHHHRHQTHQYRTRGWWEQRFYVSGRTTETTSLSTQFYRKPWWYICWNPGFFVIPSVNTVVEGLWWAYGWTSTWSSAWILWRTCDETGTLYLKSVYSSQSLLYFVLVFTLMSLKVGEKCSRKIECDFTATNLYVFFHSFCTLNERA